MKIKHTTKLFIVVNFIVVLFRTLQILFLTESKTTFLKEDLMIINIIGTAVSVLALCALYFNASLAVHRPEKINCSGKLLAVALAASGSFYLAGGIMSLILKPYGWQVISLLLSLSVAATVVFIDSALKQKAFSKVWPLTFIAYWIVEFIRAYLFYTKRPLRVRTVYETAALCFIIAFSVFFGKAVSGVKTEKSFRRIYSLGLTACSLCVVSVLPEMIATVFGFGENVTESAVMPVTLIAAAVFIGFITINTFKKQSALEQMELENISSSSVEDEETVATDLDS